MVLSVEHCGAAGDLLYSAVEEGLPGFVAHLDASDRFLPRFVHKELEAFVACGDFRQGFACLACEGCNHHRPFSCKGRGFCPSCGGRRMAERAAHWVDHVLPVVGVRQWVLTFPWKIRMLLARRHDVVLDLLRIASEAIEQWYEAALCRQGVEGGRTGSVAVLQRFGSALRLNVHAHMLWLDGVYREESDGQLRWHPSPSPSTREVQTVVDQIAADCEAWLVAEGLDVGEEEDSADAQQLLQAGALQGLTVVGPRRWQKARRMVTVGGREVRLPERCAVRDGYNLHAAVRIAPRDREVLERLCRYVNRPALAKSRLDRRADGAVVLRLKKPWSDGTTAFVFTPEELVGRLAALVPLKHSNLVIYRGVLAPRSRYRARVVAEARSPVRKAVTAEERRLCRADRRSHPLRPRWSGWRCGLARALAAEDGGEAVCYRVGDGALLGDGPHQLAHQSSKGELEHGPLAEAVPKGPPLRGEPGLGPFVVLGPLPGRAHDQPAGIGVRRGPATHGLEAAAQPGLQRRGVAAAVHGLVQAVEHRGESLSPERFLAREVVVERGLGVPDLRGDVGHVGLAVAARAEVVRGGAQELLAAAHLPTAGARSGMGASTGALAPIRRRSFSTSWNTTGTTTSVSTVDESSPPITASPMGARDSPPSP